jgi:HD-like signal output (HDOD) protein
MDPATQLVEQVEQLPTLPDVALKVNEELEKEDFSLTKVSEMIALDAALSGPIMQLANSVMFGATSPVANLNTAIVRLGTREVKNLVMTVSIMKSLPKLPSPYTLRSFWSLGLASAITARRIAADLRYGDPEEAYLAALVHLMGEALLAFGHSDRFLQAIHTAQEDGIPMDAALEEEFGCGHPDVCAHLLEIWNFPEPILAAARHQLMPSEAGDAETLATIVFAADRICRDLALGVQDSLHHPDPWIGDIPAGFVERIREVGFPDLTFYLIELQNDLEQIEDFTTSIFQER